VVAVGAGSNITVGDGNNDIVSSGSNSTVTLGKGNDTIYVGSNNTITVGTGRDSFIFEQATQGSIGAVTVTGFDPEQGQFHLLKPVDDIRKLSRQCPRKCSRNGRQCWRHDHPDGSAFVSAATERLSFRRSSRSTSRCSPSGSKCSYRTSRLPFVKRSTS
jgi:hypothetical protein